MADKLLVVVVTDEEDRASIGVHMASRMIERGKLADVRVLFFGPSERLLAHPPAQMSEALEVVRRAAKPMACRAVAERLDVLAPLEAAGVELVAAGQEIEQRLLEGYQLMTF